MAPASAPPDDARLRRRLEELRREQASGLEALAELQRKEQELRTTLLRISGAIQVLEEMLESPTPPETA
jgi:uncharacterized protein (DUF3084 family)